MADRDLRSIEIDADIRRARTLPARVYSSPEAHASQRGAQRSA